jgi:hypothetical protein
MRGWQRNNISRQGAKDAKKKIRDCEKISFLALKKDSFLLCALCALA